MGVERDDFYRERYLEVALKRRATGIEHALHLGEEARLSALCDISGIQDGFTCRALHRARRLSDLLLDERGNLVGAFDFPGYLAPPGGESDHLIMDHVRRVFAFLKKNRQALAPFALPVCGRWIEEVICRSLQLPLDRVLTTRDVRRAVLSALLTPLRQNVGSCFATAPAILIQQEQPENFLSDLLQIMKKGKLSRVFGGVEHTVPVSPSWGHGDLRKVAHPLAPGLQQKGVPRARRGESVESLLNRSDEPEEAKAVFKSVTEHALLKVWEFTVASLSDLKHEFYKWNLFASLGFDMKEEGGIGSLVAGIVNDLIGGIDVEGEKHREEALLASDRARMTEMLFKQADSAEKARRLKGEHQAHLHHMRASEDLYKDGVEKGENLKKLFTFLFDQYSKWLPHYFQEVYDPDMFDVLEGQFEDSPAGFRLVYKYGRSDPSAWHPIRSEEEYIDALCDFFSSIEPTILFALEWKEGEEVISTITTEIVRHIRTEEFLRSALARVAALHAKVGIDKAEHKKKRPWSYVSGGSMSDLIRCYYGREGKVSEERHSPENALDLSIFIIDLLKNLPQVPETMLMHSPTHAFLLKPQMEGWRERGFTYTWARDRIIGQGESFYGEMRLTDDEQEFVMRRMGMHEKPIYAECSIDELREILVRHGIRADLVDSELRKTFPLIGASEWPILAREVLTDMMAPEKAIAEGPGETVTAYGFANIVLAALAQGHDSLLYSRPPYIELQKSLQKRKLAPPSGLVFADTNWSGFSFAVVYNPGTKSAELWRMDALGMWGVPMRDWVQGVWSVYARPGEYSSFIAMDPRYKKV